MSSLLSSFDSSKLGAFIQSQVLARGNQGTTGVGGIVVVDTNYAMYSADGAAWAKSTLTAVPAQAFHAVAYGGSTPCFVAVGSPIGGGNVSMRSTDLGVTWTSNTCPTGAWLGVAWSGSKFCAVSQLTSHTQAMTSSDGITWVASASGLSALQYRAVCWTGSQFVAVADGGWSAFSSDGVTWVMSFMTGGVAGFFQWDCVASNGAVVVSQSSSTDSLGRTIEVFNGATWNGVISPFINTDVDAIAVNPAGTFVATCSGGSGGAGGTQYAMSSGPTGTTWVGRTTPPGDFYWYSVCWSPSTSQFIAVNNVGPTYIVMTSPDGLTWTGTTLALTDPFVSGGVAVASA